MDSKTRSPKLYSELASWWPLLSAPEEYAEAARFFRQALIDACEIVPGTILELGSGGGNNASHLKRHFELTLIDQSPNMLEVSRRLNPECEHIEGDMRSVRLNREFDCVFVHDAVSYMTTEEDLRAAMKSAFMHCRSGGAALFAPDHTRENYRPETRHGGHDGEHKSLRYLEWSWDPDPTDTSYVVDFAYLLRAEDGTVRAEQDRHLCGLFPRETWLRLLVVVGFEPTVLPFEHSDLEYGADIFIGRKLRV